MKGFKKNTNRVIILVTFILSTLANCNLFKPQKVENDNLLYGLLILSQNKPLYSVVVTARLEDNSSIPIKDGLIKFVDSSSYLSADQGTLQDFTSCANDTVNAGTADSTIDGDFTILFKTASLKGNLSLSVLKSVAGTPTTTCSAIANYAPSAFTTSVGTPWIGITGSGVNAPIGITSKSHRVPVSSIRYVTSPISQFFIMTFSFGRLTCI